MNNESTVCIEYDLDAGDDIIDIRGEWDAFALENGAPALTAGSVIGQNLWDYIDGTDVRAIYRMLVDHTRSTGKPKRLNFNCDDNEHVRLFQLRIVPMGSNTVRFESTLVRSHRRESVPLFEAAIARAGDAILTVCSVCKFIDTDGAWLPVEEALARLNLLTNPVMPLISHGLCPSCFEIMSAELDKDERTNEC